MKITRAGQTPSTAGPADWFTGTVRIDPLFAAEPPGRAAGAHVTFEPGARTAWHTHPAGQILIVTFGRGRVQREGGPVEEISAGDVVWFPAGEKRIGGDMVGEGRGCGLCRLKDRRMPYMAKAEICVANAKDDRQC